MRIGSHTDKRAFFGILKNVGYPFSLYFVHEFLAYYFMKSSQIVHSESSNSSRGKRISNFETRFPAYGCFLLVIKIWYVILL